MQNQRSNELYLARSFGDFLIKCFGDDVTFEQADTEYRQGKSQSVSISYKGEHIGFVVKDDLSIMYIGNIPDYVNPRTGKNSVVLEQCLFGSKNRIDGLGYSVSLAHRVICYT